MADLGAQKPDSIFLSEFPIGDRGLTPYRDTKLEEKFSRIWEIRDAVLKSLEEARQAKTLGHPREARIRLSVPEDGERALRAAREDLARLFLVSELELVRGARIEVAVERAAGSKCARCWTYATTVGKSAKHSDLCGRCVEAVQ